MIKYIFWIFLLITSCGLHKTDDFDYVDRTSTIDKKVLSDGDEFKMTLTIKNSDSKTKELTFFKDFNASIQIWSSWYCDSQIQKAQPRIYEQEPDRNEKYLIKLQQGDSISFDLTGRFLTENDTFKIVFDKYNEVLYIPKVSCDSILICEISGMWMPGRPYLADSYEYYFNSNTLTINLSDTGKNNQANQLLDVFEKAVTSFPNDSASLYRFYFKRNSTTDQEKNDKQIKRLEKLTTNESVDRYRNIENNLKPLMTRIVNSKTISQPQSDSLVKLYSDYDYFSGESLFSRLLTNNENYDLVWESFRIMVKESKTDTCFISGLIQLDKNIRTNVELGQAMQDFTVQAVRNNPIGFLEMYGQRNSEQRTDFANYIAIWDSPDKELLDKYSEIAEKSTDKNYKKLATELIGKFKD